MAMQYHLPKHVEPKKVGVVMPGNIPLAGFYDVLSVFLTGNIAMIKPSVKDQALIRQLVTIHASGVRSSINCNS
jgi:acyl-CoA reductase-like NAD-dependent aldehyde dehydrogenase